MSKRLFWLGTWIAAVVGLSHLFAAVRNWPGRLEAWYVVSTAGWFGVLAGAMFLLTLRMYARERAMGHVVRRIGIFERILERGDDRA
jgi:hypothetical protein